MYEFFFTDKYSVISRFKIVRNVFQYLIWNKSKLINFEKLNTHRVIGKITYIVYYV